jgi:hypothetical protein
MTQSKVTLTKSELDKIELLHLFSSIEDHNREVCESYSPTEKIDFNRCLKNWGSDVIPKKFWIDSYKNYITKSGKKVINLEIKLTNSNGNEVTYPVKGTILTKKGNKITTEYAIWSLDGRSDVVKGNNLNNDLVLSD